jgi:LPXTG-motif cell wall-anchored protein
MRKWVLVAMVGLALVLPALPGSAQETTQVKEGCGQVIKVVGNTVVVRVDETNRTRVFKNVSPDIHFIVDGKKTDVYGLRAGMSICAYRTVHVAEPMVIYIEDHEVETVVDEPDEHDAPKPAPAPAPAPKPEPAPAPVLPKTGSSLPFAGLFGLMLLGLSAGIAVIRRF